MTTHPLLQRAQEQGTPLIDGDTVTFILEAETQPYLVADFNNWGWRDGQTPRPFEPTDAPNLWVLRVDFPSDTYMEYGFILDTDPDSERTPDPFNLTRTRNNGFGKFNHFFTMPQAEPTRYVKRRRKVPHGTVTPHTISSIKRKVWLYQPPVEMPVPLVVVYDGKDYLQRGFLPTIVDNLLADGKIAPIALAMIENGGSARMSEYNCGESTLVAVTELLLPLAREHLNLMDIDAHPGAYGVLGASMGGLMAFYTGLRLPHIFGHSVSQSGAFLPFMQAAPPVFRLLIDTFSSPPPLKIWLDVGTMEWLHTPNREHRALLDSRGWDVTFLEYNAGHNYTAWSNALEKALPAVFPPAG